MIPILRLLRPQQWTKNVFVLSPILFSGVLNAPSRFLEIFWMIFPVFVAFCAWSSAIYVLNDILDCPMDAQHPRKRNRPIASGEVGVRTAFRLFLALVIIPVLMLVVGSSKSLNILAGGAYLLNSLLYCFVLKKVVILDVVSIALGFIIRVMAGCIALDCKPSCWILICTFSLALFLGFGKRRMELTALEAVTRCEFRNVLKSYTSRTLNLLLTVTGGMSALTYIGYTLSPKTIELHGTRFLIFSVPCVLFGIVRYAYDIKTGKFDGPDEILLRDPIFLLNAIWWCVCVWLIFMWS